MTGRSEDLIKASEALALLGWVKDRNTVINMIKDGRLDGGKIGGRWVVTRSSVDELIESNLPTNPQ